MLKYNDALVTLGKTAGAYLHLGALPVCSGDHDGHTRSGEWLDLNTTLGW